MGAGQGNHNTSLPFNMHGVHPSSSLVGSWITNSTRSCDIMRGCSIAYLCGGDRVALGADLVGEVEAVLLGRGSGKQLAIPQQYEPTVPDVGRQ